MTDKRYFDEALVFEFTAQALEVLPQADGTSLVVLDKTYFYPTGGGQSCDRGTLGGLPVLDVSSEDGTVLHQVKGSPSLGTIKGEIDSAYRLANMQAHTGQHILSAAFLNAFDAPTLAVKMNADSNSTVDIDMANLNREQIYTVEKLANQIIMENRPIKSSFVAPDSPKLEELRRAVKFEKVTGDVRLVEIEDFDLVACAGTHFPSTGHLGILKILKTENYKGGSRIHFAVGKLALAQFGIEHDLLESLSLHLSTDFVSIIPSVERLQSERQALGKQVEEMRERLLRYEMGDLFSKASKHENYHLIKASFEDRSGDDMKILGTLISLESQMVAVLVNRAGADVTVIIAAASDTGLHAGNLLKSLLAKFDGKGGGRDTYAQGVLKNFGDVSALMQAVDELIQ